MESRQGAWFGLAAFVFWGLTPLFWNLVDEVDSTDLLIHRILWSVPLLLIVVGVRRQLPELWATLRSPKVMVVLAIAAALLATNWTVWLWSVTNEHIVDASLGYFINPLVSVALGVMILGERLRTAQWVAVGIAAIGVVGMAVTVGAPPWIALGLAFSFGLYGLVKKRGDVPAPLVSLSGELIVMFLPALVFLFLFHTPADARFGDSAGLTAYLMASSIVTVTPLLLFGAAAKRIPLSMIGLLQYVAPSIQLMLGVWFYGEDLALDRFVWFVIVWIALAVYTYDSVREAKSRPTPAPVVQDR